MGVLAPAPPPPLNPKLHKNPWIYVTCFGKKRGKKIPKFFPLKFLEFCPFFFFCFSKSPKKKFNLFLFLGFFVIPRTQNKKKKTPLAKKSSFLKVKKKNLNLPQKVCPKKPKPGKKNKGGFLSSWAFF